MGDVPAPLPEYLEFLSPYDRGIQQLALALRTLVLEESPGCTELIYDAYNAVASGYTWTGRPLDAFIHIAVYAKWVNLGFNYGAALPDPKKRLQGNGARVRHIRISSEADLEDPAIRKFVRKAIEQSIRPKGDPPPPKRAVRAVYEKRRRPER